MTATDKTAPTFDLKTQVGAKVEMTPRPKLSNKVICGKVKAPENDTPIPLYEVAGVAYSKQIGESDKGEWTKLLGDFIACNCKTGKLFRSMQLFLPNVAGNLVISGLTGATAFKFAFRIGISKDDDSVSGFVYYAEPLISTAMADPNRLLADVLSTPMLEQGRNSGPERVDATTGEVLSPPTAGKKSKAA